MKDKGNMHTPDWSALHRFWFSSPPAQLDNSDSVQAYLNERNTIWFGKDPTVDRTIHERFAPWLDLAATGKLSAWLEQPQSAISLIVLFDQVPRNSFRESSRMFAYDAHALTTSLNAMERFEKTLSVFERSFLYLPLEHSEDLTIQRLSVTKFEALAKDCTHTAYTAAIHENFSENLDYARRHLEIIERFGRFPHRNGILRRDSTPEEIEFLKTPRSSF